ncbi:MAG: hypothetical protein WBD31_02240, partial [Rubripirellula sp.]
MFLAQHGYGYDIVGRLAEQSGRFTDGVNDLHLHSREFAYDEAGQLTQAIETIDVSTFVRDYTDGRSSTSTDWTISVDNRLAQDDRYDYQYDMEGRLTRRTPRVTSSALTQDHFTWDPVGRLIRVVEKDTSGLEIQTIHYGYDANGLMIGRRVEAPNDTVLSHTGYLHEGLQRVAELDLSGIDPTITSLFFHGTEPNEIVVTDVFDDGAY